MARAYGWNARLLLGFEKTYGNPAAKGSFHLVPFISSSLDSEQGLIESGVLGLGRDPTAPFRDVINVDGDIVAPVDVRNIGVNLPSLSLELGLPDVPDYSLFSGVRANSMAFNFRRSGEAQVTIGLMGQGETATKNTCDDKPRKASYGRFSQFQGSIKRAGSPLANVTEASIAYANNLERIETIRDDGKVEGIDPGMSALTGSISARYGDNALMDLARAGTPIDIELAYVIDADRKLQITAREVYLPKPKRSVSGPGGIEASYDFQGAKDAASGKMLTVTLTNDVENYL